MAKIDLERAKLLLDVISAAVAHGGKYQKLSTAAQAELDAMIEEPAPAPAAKPAPIYPKNAGPDTIQPGSEKWREFNPGHPASAPHTPPKPIAPTAEELNERKV